MAMLKVHVGQHVCVSGLKNAYLHRPSVSLQKSRRVLQGGFTVKQKVLPRACELFVRRAVIRTSAFD